MELKYDVTFDEVDKLKTLVTTRKICSLVSIAACVIIMIIYFVLLFQKIFAKRRKLKRISNANYQKEKEINSSFQRTGSMIDNSDQNKNSATKGFGLGSHAMFFLILTNLLWSINSVVLFILMVFLSFWITISLYVLFTASCTTTVISFLFFSSMKATALAPNEGKKKLIQGAIFSFGFPMLICLTPFYSSSYGPSGSYCSINRLNEQKPDIIWGWVIQIYPILCIFYCFYAVIKVAMFYHKKLKLLKEHNMQEYKSLRKYVYIFILFPLILSPLRTLKFLNFGLKLMNHRANRLCLCICDLL